MNGYIKLHRSLLEWEWWDDINAFRLFMTILLMANWKSKKWHGKTIKRGQLWTSVPSLAEKSGLSIQQTKTALKKLKSTGEITDKATHEGRLITVAKYEMYQSNEPEITDKATHNKKDKQPTTNRPLTTTEEREEYKKGRRGKSSPLPADGLLYFGDIE